MAVNVTFLSPTHTPTVELGHRPEDQNYLISKECWVDRGQLEGEDRSTRAQVRAILNRLDLLCTRIAETLLKS